MSSYLLLKETIKPAPSRSQPLSERFGSRFRFFGVEMRKPVSTVLCVTLQRPHDVAAFGQDVRAAGELQIGGVGV